MAWDSAYCSKAPRPDKYVAMVGEILASDFSEQGLSVLPRIQEVA
jgi:hypothetical protein